MRRFFWLLCKLWIIGKFASDARKLAFIGEFREFINSQPFGQELASVGAADSIQKWSRALDEAETRIRSRA